MKTKINELCRAVGITTAYQLQKATDLSPSQAARLYRDEVEAISLSVLEKLCNTLNCNPNAIFGYDASESVKRHVVQEKAETPVKRSETPKATASGKGMNVKDVIERLKEATGRELSPKRITEYINEGKLKSTQNGKRSPHSISEPDYAEFEIYYRKLIEK